MWNLDSNFEDTPAYYQKLEKELLGLIEGEKNLVANLANIASWIYHSFPGLNWSGFYLWSDEDQELVLGPFQGKPACLRIKPNRGVCGTAYSKKETMCVMDVHEFPGHIACDAASRSELVVPLLKDGKVMGVLDLDSPELGQFSETAKHGFDQIMKTISPKIF